MSRLSLQTAVHGLLILVLSVAALSAQRRATATRADPNRLVRIPTLQVLATTGPDSEAYGTSWQGNVATNLRFRWTHESVDAYVALYEVRRPATGSDPIASGLLWDVPAQEEYSTFSIDFGPIDTSQPDSPGANRIYDVSLTLFRYVPGTGLQDTERIATSGSVGVALLPRSSATTTFDNVPVPRLLVHFDRIEVTDDSDDLSDGELGFALWAEFGDTRTALQIHHASVGTGGDTAPNKTLTIENPPSTVVLKAYGFDDDENEFLPLLIPPFFVAVLGECGQLPNPDAAPGDDCPAHEARGDQTLTNVRIQVGVRPFDIFATGDSLRFRVTGRWEYRYQ